MLQKKRSEVFFKKKLLVFLAVLLLLPVMAVAEESATSASQEIPATLIITNERLPGYCIGFFSTRKDAYTVLEKADLSYVEEPELSLQIYSDKESETLIHEELEGKYTVQLKEYPKRTEVSGYCYTTADPGAVGYDAINTYFFTLCGDSPLSDATGLSTGEYFTYSPGEKYGVYYVKFDKKGYALISISHFLGDTTVAMHMPKSPESGQSCELFYGIPDLNALPIVYFQEISLINPEKNSDGSKTDRIKDGMVEDTQNVLNNIGN